MTSWAMACISSLCSTVTAVGGLLFYCGIPIGAFYWYKQHRTRGRLVLSIGFALSLLGGSLHTILGLVGFRSIPLSLFLNFWTFAALLLALVGFALVVLRES